jgi:hypothetical protein
VTWIKVSNDRDEKFNGALKRQISGGKDTWFVTDNLGECVIICYLVVIGIKS